MLPQRLPRNLFCRHHGHHLLHHQSGQASIPYSVLGLLQVGNLLTVLILSPFAFIGVRIGIYLNRRFEDAWFNRIIYVILFLTGLQLVIGRSSSALRRLNGLTFGTGQHILAVSYTKSIRETWLRISDDWKTNKHRSGALPGRLRTKPQT
ncbi:MAG: hypothetical protein R2854_15975 [Caldilineaceae bacterium]